MRELPSRRDAEHAVSDRNKRKRGAVTNWRVAADSTLDRKARGKGGLAGTGDAGTQAAKREERNKRAQEIVRASVASVSAQLSLQAPQR